MDSAILLACFVQFLLRLPFAHIILFCFHCAVCLSLLIAQSHHSFSHSLPLFIFLATLFLAHSNSSGGRCLVENHHSSVPSPFGCPETATDVGQ